MKTQAAVLVELNKPLVLVDLEIPPLKEGQVLVEVHFSGVCHTQLLECRGYRGEDRFLPHCLGHEGSGAVLEIGPGVKKVKPYDPVILSWMKGGGIDSNSTSYLWDNRKVNAGGITTFSRHAVVSENRLTVLPRSFPMNQAALLGCAVPTALGTLWNTAQVGPGQSIAIFGIGGIGLCAVAGASIAGCWPIIAVDIRPEKLDLAKSLGATHVVLAQGQNAPGEILSLCPGGADFAIDATGRPEVMSQLLQCVRSQGGTAVVIGNARHGERIELDPWQLNLGKRLLGTWGGDNVPDRDFHRYCKLVSSGRLNLEPFLTKTYSLDEANQAIDDLESGKTIRPLLRMNQDL